MLRSALLILAGARVATAGDFPFLFDVHGRGDINVSDFVGVPRVQFDKIRECPHPCGLIPYINPKTGEDVNGGIPQLANFTLHFDTLTKTFDKFIPLDDDRWIDMDYERWDPIYDRASSVYRNRSIAEVRKKRPSETDEGKILEEARRQYESAALNLLVSTVDYVRKIRPHLKIGFYGWPTRYYYDGYHTEHGDELRADNDRLQDLWCSVDGLFPSVYQFYSSCEKGASQLASNKDYVFANVEEAVRLAASVPEACGKPAPPVLVYTWHRYHGDLATAKLICDQDEAMYWTESAAAGADGLIMWGSEVDASRSREFTRWYLTNFTTMLGGWQPPAVV